MQEENVFDQFLEKPEMAKLISWTFISLDKENSTIKLSFNAIKLFANPLGVTHGGFVVAMLDEVMGSCVVGITNAKKFATTISLTTDFIKPVALGTVFAIGKITSMQKRTAFLESSLFDENENLLARATGSYRIFDFDPSFLKGLKS